MPTTRRRASWTRIAVALATAAIVLAPGAHSSASNDGRATEAMISEGARELVAYNFDRAYEVFGEAIAQSPPGELRLRATFGRAMAAHQITPPTRSLIEEARALFQEVLDSSPASLFAPRAAMSLARIREVRDYPGDSIDLPGARSIYERVIRDWPEDRVADEAALRFAGTYTQQFDDAEAIRRGLAFLEDWLARRPTNPFASLMWLHLGDTRFERLSEPDAAVACYLKADALGLPSQSNAALLYWRIAALSERRPELLDTAIAYYQKVILVTPTSGRAFEAQTALRRIRDAHPDKRGLAIPEIRLFRVDATGDSGTTQKRTDRGEE